MSWGSSWAHDARSRLPPVGTTLAAGSTEAEWRTAVSRAYYAAFHGACDLLFLCGFSVPRAEQAHAYLSLRLSNAGDAQVVRAGKRLQLLRRNRNWADYEFRRLLDQLLAKSQVQIAQDILSILEAAALEPIKTQITNTMKIYERNVLRHVTWHP